MKIVMIRASVSSPAIFTKPAALTSRPSSIRRCRKNSISKRPVERPLATHGASARQVRAAVPDRVGAVASFHGGGLVTNMPNSPHLQAAKTKAQFLIDIAEPDDMRSPNDKTAMKETFAKANLPAEIEVYAGTLHGWCPPDAQVYNQAQAEKAWSRMMALFSSALA